MAFPPSYGEMHRPRCIFDALRYRGIGNRGRFLHQRETRDAKGATKTDLVCLAKVFLRPATTNARSWDTDNPRTIRPVSATVVLAGVPQTRTFCIPSIRFNDSRPTRTMVQRNDYVYLARDSISQRPFWSHGIKINLHY